MEFLKTTLLTKKMELSELDKNSVVVLFSKRGGGKTFACLNFLSTRKSPLCVVISEDVVYLEHVPKENVYKKCSDELINSILKRQKWAVKHAKKNPFFDPSVILVIDGSFTDMKLFRFNKTLDEIFSNVRDLKITLVICIQHLKIIKPVLRQRIDYILAFTMNNQKDKKNLFEEYCYNIMDKKIFKTVLEEYTKEWGAVVIKPHDEIFYTKTS